MDQVWYADDACACGSIQDLLIWWNQLCVKGPVFGYFVNAPKTWLVSKERFHSIATTLFSDTDVQITSAGRSYRGAAIGSNAYVQEFVRDKVVGWSAEYSALTHGLSSHWLYLCRTIPNISEVLQSLEDNIRLVLIPSLTGCSPPNDTIRKLFALPPRYGGLGIINPTLIAAEEYSASCHITEPLSQFILDRGTNSAIVKTEQI